MVCVLQLLRAQEVFLVLAHFEAEVFEILHTMEPLRVFTSAEEVVEAMHGAAHPGQAIYKAFYNSRLGGVITDPALMVVPIDDRIVHRGHSVFDTLLVVEGQTYLLQQHIDRFMRSATAARIVPPMSAEALKQTLKRLAATTGLRNCKLRYWMSAGPGTLLITPVKGMSVFYALVYESPSPREEQKGRTGFKEFTVGVPLKPQYLAIMKTTNYMLNALTAMESEEKGGHYGIQKDENGFIQECSVANISFVLPGNRFVTPPFSAILTGTVLTRLLVLAARLQEEGVLASVEQRPIHIDEARTAVELIESGGDSMSPVIEWDGVVVGEGRPGPIYRRLEALLLEEIYGSDPQLKEAIEYPA